MDNEPKQTDTRNLPPHASNHVSPEHSARLQNHPHETDSRQLPCSTGLLSMCVFGTTTVVSSVRLLKVLNTGRSQWTIWRKWRSGEPIAHCKCCASCAIRVSAIPNDRFHSKQPSMPSSSLTESPPPLLTSFPFFWENLHRHSPVVTHEGGPPCTAQCF